LALSKGDDFPIHQTAEPIAYAGTDRNFYDRYFFNGYAPDGSGFFAGALGVYPQLGIMDAHFCVIREGVQHCIHASRTLNAERMDLICGPISIDIIEPLNVLLLSVAESEGISAELEFSARAFPIEEPRFTQRIGTRAFMDYTRMTQNGSYSGWISVDGERAALSAGTIGTRDRSWGVRPIGARDPQPIPEQPMPAFFWQWTPLNLASGSLFFHINADTQGNPWNTRAAWAVAGAGAADIVEGAGVLQCELEKGTRWPVAGQLSLEPSFADKMGEAAARHPIALEKIGQFQMKGLGYTHPKWGHGIYHGEEAAEREDIELAGLDPLAPENLHVQMLVRLRGGEGGEADLGIGVFEQLIIGPYAPLGLSEFLDGAP
jgi:hypothetical protein